ncbi:conjugal transfer protein TraH [Photobacterium damselae]|uniref:conjugal transfer protein TraH n=1 Tax=Photobacterium damselae TaxID=38293 RepID=UPI000D65F408|nr:conjugal transfer protein TraH [Photobacterium damselae]AWK84664.1 hypothetical protein BST98_21800 [Photobacterium damselae]TLS83973.1 hypothetical protein FD720_18405 [Photobacterium damselae subsp. damselae]
MKIFKFNKSAINVVLAISIATASVTPANASNFLEDVFSQMTTVGAGGGAFETQRRNGYAFGMTSVRFHLHEPTLIQFTPPSMNAGCGGIDMFGGSFSIIKREELVQVARNVASGAAVYAFNMAVQSICPSCAQIMQSVSGMVERMNKLAKASCQDVSKTLMEQPFSQEISSNIRNAVGLEGWAGKASSWVDNLLPTEGSFLDMLNDNKIRQPNGQKEFNDKGLTGNLIDNLFKASGANYWNFVGFNSEQEVKELIMSLVGVRIVDVKTISSSSKAPKIKTVLPTIKSIQELIFADNGKPLKVLKCKTDIPGCIDFVDIKGSPKANWVGTYPQAKRLLLGNGNSSDGIAAKITRKLEISADQKKFLNTVPVPLMSTLFMLSHNPEAQKQYADVIARLVSQQGVEAIVEGIDRILSDIALASEGSQNASKDAILALKEGRERLQRELDTLKTNNQAELEKMDVLVNLTKHLENKAAEMSRGQ